MGRNDISRMGYFSAFTLLQKIAVLFFFAGLLVSSNLINAFSQDEAKKGDGPPQYLLTWGIPATITNVYKMTETTNVWRQFSDSTVKQYKREYTYYFSLKAPNPTDKGFLTIEVSTDSLFYKFTEGTAVYEFDSQADNPGAVNFEDLKAISVPLGKNFDMIFSPYGDVAEVKGEKLDWFRNYVTEQGKGYLDSASNFLWLDGISKERLQYICDVKKILLPKEPVFKDSTWVSPFGFQLESINFSDTVKAKITQIIEGYKTIVVKSDNLKSVPGNTRFYGIKGQLLPVENATGRGTFTISLTPKGTIRRAEGDFSVELTSKVRRDVFKERITTNVVWELVTQFKE